MTAQDHSHTEEAALLKTGALQNAIFNSANFSIIATDEKGVIQLFNVGAERMLGYGASGSLQQSPPTASEIDAMAASSQLKLFAAASLVARASAGS